MKTMESKLMLEFRETLKGVLCIRVQIIFNFLYTFETGKIIDEIHLLLLKAYRRQTFQETIFKKLIPPPIMPNPFLC